MPDIMPHITPSRVAALAAAAAAVAASASALIALYVSMVAVAILLGAAFAAYLAMVDEPGEWAAFELGACAISALLTLAGTSLRFPAVVSASSPSAAVKLAWLAFAVSAAAAVTSLAREHGRDLWSLRDAGAARLTRRT
jgi:hypothetical protein